MTLDLHPRLLLRFAEILEYPGPSLVATAQECEVLASKRSQEAAALLREFLLYARWTPPGRMEEIYTGTFDLAAACSPYVGYHLFGESYKRSVFMVRLKELYRAHSYAVAVELPDHLAVLLRFLAVCQDSALVEELICDALLPALEKMAADPGEDTAATDEQGPGGPKVYRQVLAALRLALLGRAPEDAACQLNQSLR